MSRSVRDDLVHKPQNIWRYINQQKADIQTIPAHIIEACTLFDLLEISQRFGEQMPPPPEDPPVLSFTLGMLGFESPFSKLNCFIELVRLVICNGGLLDFAIVGYTRVNQDFTSSLCS